VQLARLGKSDVGNSMVSCQSRNRRCSNTLVEHPARNIRLHRQRHGTGHLGDIGIVSFHASDVTADTFPKLRAKRSRLRQVGSCAVRTGRGPSFASRTVCYEAIGRSRRSSREVAENLDRVGDHLGICVRNVPLWPPENSSDCLVQVLKKRLAAIVGHAHSCTARQILR
jgi:hypothetical protein